MPEATHPEGMSREDIHDWLRTHFPRYEKTMRLEETGGGRARVRYLVTDQHLRPGGTVMGPILMLVADVAMYAALIGMDRRTTAAFTSNLNISFLHRPAPRDLIGEAEEQEGKVEDDEQRTQAQVKQRAPHAAAASGQKKARELAGVDRFAGADEGVPPPEVDLRLPEVTGLRNIGIQAGGVLAARQGVEDENAIRLGLVEGAPRLVGDLDAGQAPPFPEGEGILR